MAICEEQLRENFARNLSDLRRRAGLTQLELAEELNYSDKSISKWERGDGLPDLFVVAQIAELFEVTVNDMISSKVYKKPLFSRNKLLTTILAIGVPWLVASVLFFVLQVSLPSFPAWFFYIYALIPSSIIALVFSNIWWNKLFSFISASAIIWSCAVCIFLTFVFASRIWLIFVVAAVVQAMTVISYLRKK